MNKWVFQGLNWHPIKYTYIARSKVLQLRRLPMPLKYRAALFSFPRYCGISKDITELRQKHFKSEIITTTLIWSAYNGATTLNISHGTLLVQPSLHFVVAKKRERSWKLIICGVCDVPSYKETAGWSWEETGLTVVHSGGLDVFLFSFLSPAFCLLCLRKL